MDAAGVSRLRKAFKYPEEDEGDVSHDELDEEQQENVVEDMKAKDAKDNETYTLIFSILPLTIIFPFLYYPLNSPPSVVLPCLLAITSLCSTAYTMRYVPVDSPVPSVPGYSSFSLQDSPIPIFLPYLNALITIFLGIISLVYRSRWTAPGLWLFLLLPGLVLVMVTVARKSMADIQSGIEELDGLKYNYKGA